MDTDDKDPSSRSTDRRPLPLLSPAELATLVALEDLAEELQHAATMSEVAERLGWKSTGSVAEYVERLRRKGVVTGRGRALRVVR